MCELQDAKSGTVLLTDPGFSTRGMLAAARFQRYKREVHSGRHIGGLFYGVYRRVALATVMPMPKIIGMDHLVLAGLTLRGEFVTIPEPLLVKRRGGASSSHRANARSIMLKNPLMICFPYLVRETYLQRMIYGSPGLSVTGRLGLSAWSWLNYLWLVLRLCVWCTYGNLPEPIQRWIKRLLGR